MDEIAISYFLQILVTNYFTISLSIVYTYMQRYIFTIMLYYQQTQKPDF